MEDDSRLIRSITQNSQAIRILMFKSSDWPQTLYIVLYDLEFAISLLQPHEFGDYRFVLSHLVRYLEISIKVHLASHYCNKILETITLKKQKDA